MNKLLLILLSLVSFYSYSGANTKVYNNYIALSLPEYVPHSTLIKRQEIVSDKNLGNYSRFEDEKVVIESNDIGTIILIDHVYKTKSSYDYTKKVNINTKNNNCKIVLNQHNDIQDIIPLTERDFYCDSHHYVYDEYFKVIKHKLVSREYTIVNNIIYKDNNLIQSIESEFRGVFETELVFKDTINFIYDDSYRLVETKNMFTDESPIHCYFSHHNQYGDWTVGHCFKSGYNLGSIIRKLEYWE